MNQAPVLSLHPHFKGDVNLPYRARPGFVFSESEVLSRARCVVVSQAVGKELYREILSLCPRVFPDYRLRWCYAGKTGVAALARRFHLPAPATLVYKNVAEFRAFHPPGSPPFAFPFVIKSDEGGGGNGVFCAKSQEDIEKILYVLDNFLVFSQKGLVAQKFVQHGGADLRVVVLGAALHPYWRVQEDPAEFRNNVGRGAKLAFDIRPERTRRGLALGRQVLEETGINCAALDIAFDGDDKTALLMEVNFVFGRKGMGGSRRFRSLFAQAAEQWIRSRY